MMSRTLRCVLIVLLSLSFAASALAQRGSASASSAREAAAIATQQRPGKVLSVKRDNGEYRVKILHEGKVKYVIVKASD